MLNSVLCVPGTPGKLFQPIFLRKKCAGFSERNWLLRLTEILGAVKEFLALRTSLLYWLHED